MEKKVLIAWVYWIMIFVVVATCIFVVVYLKSNATSCLTDPISFFQNHSDNVCYCTSQMFP